MCLVPIFARQNPIDAIGAAGRIARKLGAEKAELDSRRFRSFSTANVSMAIVQFTDQLADEVGEIVAMIHEGKERGILVVHRFPIDAVHGRGIEEVTHLPPRFVVDLLPLGTAIELHIEACRSAYDPWFRVLSLGRSMIGVILVDFHQHLLSVETDLVTVDVTQTVSLRSSRLIGAEMPFPVLAAAPSSHHRPGIVADGAAEIEDAVVHQPDVRCSSPG